MNVAAVEPVAPAQPPRYRVARDWLERQLGRTWAPGDRLPTIAELTELVGVGHVNIHRAVRELAREGYLVARPGSGTFVADPLPRSNTKRHAAVKHVRLVTLATHELMLHRVWSAMQSRLEDAGCKVDVTQLSDYRRMDFRGRFPDDDALIILNPNLRPDIFFDAHQVMVVVNTAVETPVAMPGRFDVVSVEQEHGGWLAGDCLRRAGVRDACFLGVQMTSKTRVFDATSRTRLEGFERGLGAAIAPEHRLMAVAYGIDTGAGLVEHYLKLRARPRGVFAASDELAVGFLTGALAHGLAAGRDYDLVGFDGQQIGKNLHGGALTTVEVPADSMAERAAELLLDRLQHPDQPVRRLQLGCGLFDGATVRRS